MARKPRIHQPGGVHHAYSIGSGFVYCLSRKPSPVGMVVLQRRILARLLPLKSIDLLRYCKYYLLYFVIQIGDGDAGGKN